MELLTQQDVLAHQAEVPWPSLRQVEQDLLLCRAMASIFDDRFLREQVAMRGGTLLHKVYLAPPSRFSEDIDLVVFGDRPEDHVRKALRRVLAGILGSPKASVWDTISLAVRNTVRPSRILRMTYAVPPVITRGPALQIVVEANVTERKPHSPIAGLPFKFPFRRDSVSVSVNGYDIHEMLGTKTRALFQRRRGRDLFDLYWAL
jgi:predicted nucleotidyltransferase component of viral defense system